MLGNMVMLVDDDVDDVELFREALHRNNFPYQTAIAHNGQELMIYLRETQNTNLPDAVVLDLNMPVKNGFEALAEIKSDPLLKSIPVIILSASSNSADKLRCVQLGCDAYWSKPNSLKGYDHLIGELIAMVR